PAGTGGQPELRGTPGSRRSRLPRPALPPLEEPDLLRTCGAGQARLLPAAPASGDPSARPAHRGVRRGRTAVGLSPRLTAGGRPPGRSTPRDQGRTGPAPAGRAG